MFFDYEGIASGDFESVILGNIRSRAHFIVLLTPSALERCNEPTDWLRREIEEALAIKRNIVPLMLEGFDFGTPAIANQLTGKLAILKSYNTLGVPVEYFMEAMNRLRERFLNVPLEGVLHPASASAERATKKQQAAADTAPSVREEELTAQQWFERGFNAKDPDERIRFYSQAIRLKPNYPAAFNNRGIARHDKSDLEGELQDFNEAIRLKPDYSEAFNNRGNARQGKGDLEGALEDYDEAIRLKPDYADPFNNRGIARRAKGDLEGSLQDYNEAIRLKPDYADPFNNRGIARRAKGDLEVALQDFNEAIRLKPDYANAYYNRTIIFQDKANYGAAIADLQKYLDLGGGARYGDQKEVEAKIRDLRKKLAASPEKTKTNGAVKPRKKK